MIAKIYLCCFKFDFVILLDFTASSVSSRAFLSSSISWCSSSIFVAPFQNILFKHYRSNNHLFIPSLNCSIFFITFVLRASDFRIVEIGPLEADWRDSEISSSFSCRSRPSWDSKTASVWKIAEFCNSDLPSIF